MARISSMIPPLLVSKASVPPVYMNSTKARTWKNPFSIEFKRATTYSFIFEVWNVDDSVLGLDHGVVVEHGTEHRGVLSEDAAMRFDLLRPDL